MFYIPDSLTERVVRKHFPHCEACPAANMAQQPMPGSNTEIKDLIPGDELQIDIKVLADRVDIKGEKSKAFAKNAKSKIVHDYIYP